MLPLDSETADLIAARTIREALQAAPLCHFVGVEATIEHLLSSGQIDSKLASYVLANAGRFCTLPPPRYFAAMWDVELEKTHGRSALRNASSAAGG